jgi:hypothetical protein
MNKLERIKKLRTKEIDLYNEFMKFIKNEQFIETKDKFGFFGPTKSLIFYKKVSEKVYFLFNIPWFTTFNKHKFEVDFWKVIAQSEKEFLDLKIESKNLFDLKFSFNLEKDLNFYKEELLKL